MPVSLVCHICHFFIPQIYKSLFYIIITPDLAGVDVMHNGKKVTIMRDQNQKASVNPDFAKTSRKCPPFYINPMQLASGVETLGEVEVLAYLDKMTKGDKNILVVDSRTPDWVAKGTIPGSVNIPWTKLAPQKGASPIDIAEILTTKFGVKEQEGLFDYRDAKTLVLFCNDIWCGRSPNHPHPAALRLSGRQDQMVSRWHAELVQSRTHHGEISTTMIDLSVR